MNQITKKDCKKIVAYYLFMRVTKLAKQPQSVIKWWMTCRPWYHMEWTHPIYQKY